MTEADLDALECSLNEAPLFHIDERDDDPAPEADRQAAFVKDARRCGIRIAAVPNDGKRGLKALNLARKLGAWWGFGDTVAFAPGPLVAVLEWKNGKRPPDQHQIDCLNVLHRMGVPVGVFRRADSAMAFLGAHGFPVQEPVA